MDDPSLQAMRISVTGHRFLDDPPAVQAGVQRVLRRAARLHPGQALELYSCLAEGADQLAARLALEIPGLRLVVPLPYALESYTQSFSSPAAQTAFRELLARAAQIVVIAPDLPPEPAYAAAGRFLVDRCDLLLAVWDGAPAQGPGGTGEVVEYALRSGRAVAWVLAASRQPHNPLAFQGLLGPAFQPPTRIGQVQFLNAPDWEDAK